jgi:hypothetical protein
MIFQNIDLHDPPVAFVMVFVLSLLAAIVLFKLLDSRATIKKKGWSAGGAIAGFLIILFGSWHELRPTLNSRRIVAPLSIPSGFRQISASDAGLALAIPGNWQRTDTPVTLSLSPRQRDPNVDHVNFMSVQTTPCEHLTLTENDSDLPAVKEALKKMMGMVTFRGTPVSEPFLGRKATMTPMAMTIPGGILDPKRKTDLVIDVVLREIYDEQNGRCVVLIYPDTDLGRQISSTLNIVAPER